MGRTQNKLYFECILTEVGRPEIRCFCNGNIFYLFTNSRQTDCISGNFKVSMNALKNLPSTSPSQNPLYSLSPDSHGISSVFSSLFWIIWLCALFLITCPTVEKSCCQVNGWILHLHDYLMSDSTAPWTSWFWKVLFLPSHCPSQPFLNANEF